MIAGIGATRELAEADLTQKTLLDLRRRRPEAEERAIDEAIEQAQEGMLRAAQAAARRQ